MEDSDETKKQYFRMEEVSCTHDGGMPTHIVVVIIDKVNEDLIHEYYHVSGVVAILKEYIQKVSITSNTLYNGVCIPVYYIVH